MAFLRSPSGPDTNPAIRGAKVELRNPRLADYPEWSQLRLESRAFLEPWEPVWPSNDLEKASFRRRIRRYTQEVREDLAYPFFVFRSSDGVLAGGLTLGHVRRGVTQSATLGYWIGRPYAGQGLMSDAVQAALAFAFDHLRLHRVEAACLPANAASIRLLEKTGFQREGFARRYLCINGMWQDHFLYAIVEDDPRPGSLNQRA
jgi:ribosomal-protein-alanine N-acetyltransferase